MAKKSILLNYDCTDFSQKMHVIPHIATSKNFTKEYRKDRVRFLFVGTANSTRDFNMKGGYEALEVFNILSKKYSNLELVIKSRVPDDIKLRYSANPNIRIIDEILPWALLEEEFKQADIFLFPSHMLQNTVVLEAMSYELPVITTFIGSSGGEFVEDGITGFVVPSPEALPYFKGNYMLTSETIYWELLARTEDTVDMEVIKALVERASLLIENPDLRTKMGKAARKEIDEGRFSIKRRNLKLKEIFDTATQ
jgi:glycosyltransferase involved in cell wall biosynthesis